MRTRTMAMTSCLTLTLAASSLTCSTSNKPVDEPQASHGANEPPATIWKGGVFPCSETVNEIQVTAITSGPSDDKRFASQTSMQMELLNDKERIRAICVAIGEKMSRNEVLCPPEFLEAYQAELRAKDGQVIATAVRTTRFIDSTGKEVTQDRSMWLTLPQHSVCYELSPADPAGLDKLLREVVP